MPSQPTIQKRGAHWMILGNGRTAPSPPRDNGSDEPDTDREVFDFWAHVTGWQKHSNGAVKLPTPEAAKEYLDQNRHRM